MSRPRELYTFSEDPAIPVFTPRRTYRSQELTEPVVLATDEDHQFMFYFPRKCPRILLWASDTTSPEDREQWFGHSGAKVICYLEYGWLERLRHTTIYRYHLPGDTFEDAGGGGRWLSRDDVVPSQVDEITNLIGVLQENGVELRLMDRLTPLFGLWDQTTLHWEGVRLRHAQDWQPALTPDGTR